MRCNARTKARTIKPLREVIKKNTNTLRIIFGAYAVDPDHPACWQTSESCLGGRIFSLLDPECSFSSSSSYPPYSRQRLTVCHIHGLHQVSYFQLSLCALQLREITCHDSPCITSDFTSDYGLYYYLLCNFCDSFVLKVQIIIRINIFFAVFAVCYY